MKSQVLPAGLRCKVVVLMSPEDAAAYLDELIQWLENREAVIPPKSTIDAIKKRYSGAFGGSCPQEEAPLLKKKEQKPSVERGLMLDLWYFWYECITKAGYKVSRPESITGEGRRHIRDIVVEFGEDRTREIFKLATADWAALQSRRKNIPDVPHLRFVSYHRQELADAVAAGGLTSASQRMSNYGKDRKSGSWFGQD